MPASHDGLTNSARPGSGLALVSQGASWGRPGESPYARKARASTVTCDPGAYAISTRGRFGRRDPYRHEPKR